MSTLRRAAVIAALSIVIASPASAQIDDYMAFLTHVSGSSEEVVTLTQEGIGGPVAEWAEGEIEWLISNPPDTCYAKAWGIWLLASGATYAVGIATEAGDSTTASALADWMIGDTLGDYTEILTAANVACLE